MSFYVAGGFIILSAAVCYPLPCIIRYEDGKKMDTFTEKQQRKSLVDVHVTNSNLFHPKKWKKWNDLLVWLCFHYSLMCD